MSPLFIIFLSPVKTLSSLNMERNMHRSHTVKQSKTVLNKHVGGCKRTGRNVIMDYALVFLPELLL